MSSRRNSSTSSSAKKPSKATPNLLKQALTKTLPSVETPNQSGNANDTNVGIEKAKNQFKLFKDTPRTILAERPTDDAQLVVADDLFNAAKAATKARREKVGRTQEKRKDVLEDFSVEEENKNPTESDNDISKSPGRLFEKVRLKRKSRMITTRRLSQDGSLDDRQVPAANNSEVDASDDNVEEERPPIIAPRRSIRPRAKALKESFNEVVESSVEDVSENVENEQPRTGLRRSVRPPAIRVPVVENDKGPNNDSDVDIDATPQFQAVRVQKPTLKTAFRQQIDHLQRAPTPSIEIADFRSTRNRQDINVADLDITFDPNIESTRVGLNEFDDEDGLDTSPKRSSRKKSATRLKRNASGLALSQEDRGSYLGEDEDLESLEAPVKRLSQEIMPPPTSTVVAKSTRSRRLDSVLTEEPLISDASVANIVSQQSPKEDKKKTIKKEKIKPILSDKELKSIFEKKSGLKVGPAVQPMLRQVHNELFEEAMEKLNENTQGLPPKLGDWKDMLQELGYLPKEDPDNGHLYALLRKYASYDEMLKLVPRPTLHGDGGKWTMPRDVWNQRALDGDESDDFVYGAKKKRTKGRRKAQK